MCRNMSRIFTYAHVSTGCSGKNFIWSFGCGLLMCKMGVSHPVIESIFLLVLFALDSVLLFKKYFVFYEKLFCLKIVGYELILCFEVSNQRMVNQSSKFVQLEALLRNPKELNQPHDVYNASQEYSSSSNFQKSSMYQIQCRQQFLN